MSTVKLMSSELPEMYSKGLFNEKNKNLAPEHTDKIAEILFESVALVLGQAVTKEKPASFVIDRIDESFIAGATCEYHPNEDPEKPGNFSLSWTVNEDDIPKNVNLLSLKDPTVHAYFKSVGGEKYGMGFKSAENLITIMTYFVECLIKWLDENAKKDERVEIEQEGVFKASVEIEDGEKVIAIEPDGLVKNLVKNDQNISK